MKGGITASRAAVLAVDWLDAQPMAPGDEPVEFMAYRVWSNDTTFAVDVAPKVDPTQYEGLGLALVDKSTGRITLMSSSEDPEPILATMHQVPFGN